jgi:hypothetical protein
MIAEWTDPEDELLARSVFGTNDLGIVLGMVLDWLARHGVHRALVSAIEFSVGAAVTVALPDGTRVFLKVWPGTANSRSLAAQVSVQAAMAARGFPAPAVLTRVSALGPGWAVAMAYARPGASTDARLPVVRRAMASGLARFVTEAEAYRDLDGLPRREGIAEGVTWPEPHSALFDFEATARGAEWIDEVARDALQAMRSAGSRVVVGHHDWSAKNMRMGPAGIAVLYDWDSVALDREAFVVGSAAANFPITGGPNGPETPTVSEVAAFVREYEQARGAPFTAEGLAEVAAGATYARAYKARCEHALDTGGTRWPGSSRESLRASGPFRFDRA